MAQTKYIYGNNFCANFLSILLEPNEKFIDEEGAIVSTIKVIPREYIEIYSKPKAFYDLFPVGMKPRKIKLWDDNYSWENLGILGYSIATRPINAMTRWLPKIKVQTAIFRENAAPKGWKLISRIPPYHHLRIDLNNLQIQLVGPSVNEFGYSNWYPIYQKPEHKQLWDNFFKKMREEEQQSGR